MQRLPLDRFCSTKYLTTSRRDEFQIDLVCDEHLSCEVVVSLVRLVHIVIRVHNHSQIVPSRKVGLPPDCQVSVVVGIEVCRIDNQRVGDIGDVSGLVSDCDRAAGQVSCIRYERHIKPFCCSGNRYNHVIGLVQIQDIRKHPDRDEIGQRRVYECCQVVVALIRLHDLAIRIDDRCYGVISQMLWYVCEIHARLPVAGDICGIRNHGAVLHKRDIEPLGSAVHSKCNIVSGAYECHVRG